MMEARFLATVVLLLISPTFAESLAPLNDQRPGRAKEGEKNVASLQEDSKCSDTFLRCSKWKDLNICKDHRFESYMKYGCAKTCSYCGLDSGPNPTTNPPFPTTGVVTTTAASVAPNTSAATAKPTTSSSVKPSDAPAEKTDERTRFIPERTLERLAIERETVPEEDTSEKTSDDDHVTSIMDAVQGSKRGLTFKTETMPGIWSLGDEDEVKMSDQLSPYGNEMEAAPNPMEEGKYMTPAKSDERYDYFTGHYSKDPYVAESQREEWNDRNKKITGDSYRKSTSEKPRETTSKSKSDAENAEKKANIEEPTKKRTHGKLEIHSL